MIEGGREREKEGGELRVGIRGGDERVGERGMDDRGSEMR